MKSVKSSYDRKSVEWFGLSKMVIIWEKVKEGLKVESFKNEIDKK